MAVVARQSVVTYVIRLRHLLEEARANAARLLAPMVEDLASLKRAAGLGKHGPVRRSGRTVDHDGSSPFAEGVSPDPARGVVAAILDRVVALGDYPLLGVVPKDVLSGYTSMHGRQYSAAARAWLWLLVRVRMLPMVVADQEWPGLSLYVTELWARTLRDGRASAATALAESGRVHVGKFTRCSINGVTRKVGT